MVLSPSQHGLAALLLITCAGTAGADEVGDRMREALERHAGGLVRVEATTSVGVEHLPGLSRGARRTHHVSAPGVVVDAEGLVVLPDALLDPAQLAFELLGAQSQAEVLEVSVVGQDGRVREASWLGRDPATRMAFLRVSDVGRDGLQAMSFTDTSQAVGDDLFVLYLGSASLGRPPTVEHARVSCVVSDGALLGLTPRLPHALGALVVSGDGRAVGILGPPPGERATSDDADPLRPDLLADALAGYVLGAQILRPALSNPPSEARADPGFRTRPWIGARHEQLTIEASEELGLEVDFGVRLVRLYDGPAKAAGLQENDVLVEMDGIELDLDPGESFDDLVLSYRVGERIQFVVHRAGQDLEIEVELAEGPVRPGAAPRLSLPELGLLVRSLTFFDRDELDLDAGTPGVVVVELSPDGPASRASLRPADVILRVEGQPVGGLQDLRERLGRPGAHPVTVFRRGQELTLRLRTPGS
jgi:S1-C subfamily serine protease